MLNVVLSESKQQWNLIKRHITNFQLLSFFTPYVSQFTPSSASCYNFRFFSKSHIKKEFSRTILSSHVTGQTVIDGKDTVQSQKVAYTWKQHRNFDHLHQPRFHAAMI